MVNNHWGQLRGGHALQIWQQGHIKVSEQLASQCTQPHSKVTTFTDGMVGGGIIIILLIDNTCGESIPMQEDTFLQ